MNFGTLFGISGFVIALVSLVYVRTQAKASRTQAEAMLDQVRIARRLAVLEVNLTVADRAFEMRRELIKEPGVLDAFLRANPMLEDVYARAGGIRAVAMLRVFLDNAQDIYLLRKEGIAADPHWRNWTASMVPFTNMPELRVVFENAVERGMFDGGFVDFLRAMMRGDSIPDPARSGVDRRLAT
jgi:hypothetical protein